MNRFLAPLALLGLLAAATPAAADVEIEILFGHGGQAIGGAITPVRVVVTSTEGSPLRIDLTARTGSAMVSGELGLARDVLAPGAQKVFTFLLRAPENASPAVDVLFDRQVRAVYQDRAEETRKLSIAPERIRGLQRGIEARDPVFLAVGRSAADLPETDRDVRFLPVREEDLPQVWEGYDGLEAVLWINPGETVPPDPGVVRALLRWVELGGTLVVSATRRPEVFADGDLDAALPAKILAPTPNVPYASVARELLGRGPLRRELAPRDGYDLTLLEARDGKVQAMHGGHPLVVSAPRGLGRITVIGYDPRRFREAKEELALAVLRPLAPDVFDPVPADRDDEFYYQNDDAVGAITKLLRTGGVKPPPMGLLFLFMILYVLAVGPIDYLILKKRNALKYSALTFLGFAVLFSAAAWFVSFWLFGGSALVNRITVVDVVPFRDATLGDRVRIIDYSGHYAPRGGTVRLAVQGDTVHFSDLAGSWAHMGGFGRPLPRDPVELQMTDAARPTGSISLPFRALRTLRTEVYRETTLPLDVSFEESGIIRVRNGLALPLRDAAIVGPGRYTSLGDIAAGKEAEIQGTRDPLRGDVFHHGAGAAFLPQIEMLSSLGGNTLAGDQPTRVARSIFAFSLQGAVAPGRTDTERRHLRILRQVGLDRGRYVRGGGRLFVAWTDARDPFGLPGGEGPGFRITVVRKVLLP